MHQYCGQQMLFKDLLNETRFIGEIGVDYAKKSKDDIRSQTEVFGKMLEWCSGKNKILSIHSRSATKKWLICLEALREPLFCIGILEV